jgi:uncharacterized protein (TIGR00297 family)
VARPIPKINLDWQSKSVLLVVVPYTTISVIFQERFWALHAPSVAFWILGVSLVLGVVAWKSHSASSDGAATGAAIAASLTFSTLVIPYHLWRTGLVPVLVLLLLTSTATRFGRRRKESLGTAEKHVGRGAAQVAANLGMAALLLETHIRAWIIDGSLLLRGPMAPAVALAALAEAAADTISSEIGQVLGGQPRMITTLRKAETGADGAISLAGTLAGIIAAGVVAAAGTWAFAGGVKMFGLSWAGGVFGLIFDSVLGATLERQGWLNNDAVNFLSTGSAAAFVVTALTALPHFGIG